MIWGHSDEARKIVNFLGFIYLQAGANPAIVSYNASVVKIYNCSK
jgi:hypothetical protein